MDQKTNTIAHLNDNFLFEEHNKAKSMAMNIFYGYEHISSPHLFDENLSALNQVG